ncbi:peptidoglycan bridge formation glycyltransferase FemA/FemB family protein, partial [Candidatus Dojkabacteria bacterium]|nr:peptidoglycan bridge formation glycyltransferase FemA/FemB family protein [Candidatus Dojkabacteria bacterium]
HRNLMANYALVWEIVEWGKQNGYQYFDLWGTLGENADESDKEYGFHRFKVGFGGEQINYLPAYDMIISPFWYRVFKLANKARWLVLKIKKAVLH